MCKSLVYTGPGFATLNCEGTHACQSLSATGLPDATVACTSPRKCNDDWDEATSKEYEWDKSVCHSGNGACKSATFGGKELTCDGFSACSGATFTPVCRDLQRTFLD